MNIKDITLPKKTRKSSNEFDLSLGKVPPQARDLEKAVLGAILIDQNCLYEVIDTIKYFFFYVDSHQRIFKAITSLYDKSQPVDILTVIEELKINEDLDLVGGAYFVTKLTNNVVSSANVLAHCRVISEMYLKRELIRISGNSMAEAFEDYSDAFELYDKADNELVKAQESVIQGKIEDISSSASKVYLEYEQVESTGVLGIPTMLKKYDNIFCGLVAPDLIIVAARPGAGKTSFALSITHNCSVINRIPCAWFSYEMNSVQLTRRLVSIDSNICHKKIRQGKIEEHNKKQFYNAIDRVSKSPIFIEDNMLNIRGLRTRANILLKKHKKLGFIVVDYLQLMPSVDKKSGGNRESEVSEISRGLKNLAKELNTPIIALSQLSREVEKRSDKMPQLSDLRESGAIEQDADSVLFLMRPEYYGMTEDVEIGGVSYPCKGLCIGIGAKNRHGATENMAFQFKHEIMYIKDHENDNDFSKF